MRGVNNLEYRQRNVGQFTYREFKRKTAAVQPTHVDYDIQLRPYTHAFAFVHPSYIRILDLPCFDDEGRYVHGDASILGKTYNYKYCDIKSSEGVKLQVKNTVFTSSGQLDILYSKTQSLLKYRSLHGRCNTSVN